MCASQLLVISCYYWLVLANDWYYWLLLVIIAYYSLWLVLVTLGYCWFLLVVIGYYWLLLVITVGCERGIVDGRSAGCEQDTVRVASA